jgi:hypothetical protein
MLSVSEIFQSFNPNMKAMRRRAEERGAVIWTF